MQKNRLTVGWVQLLLGADEEQIFCQNILFLTTVFFCIYGNYSTEELMFNNVFQSPLLYFSPPLILCAIPCSQHLTLFFLPWMKALLIGSGLHTWLPSTVSVHQSAVAWAVLCIPFQLLMTSFSPPSPPVICRTVEVPAILHALSSVQYVNYAVGHCRWSYGTEFFLLFVWKINIFFSLKLLLFISFQNTTFSKLPLLKMKSCHLILIS